MMVYEMKVRTLTLDIIGNPTLIKDAKVIMENNH
jgi:hypothetical protein